MSQSIRWSLSSCKFSSQNKSLERWKQILGKKKKKQTKNPSPLAFLNFSHVIICAYPEAFVQRGYGKRKETKQLAFKAFVFNRALGSCFPSKVQTWCPKVCKRLTQVFCFRLWLNVSDLHNDKNHWTSQGNLWWKITEMEQKHAQSTEEPQSHPACLKPEWANLSPAATSNSLQTLLKN